MSTCIQGAHDPLRLWEPSAHTCALGGPSLVLSRILFLVFGDTKPIKLIKLVFPFCLGSVDLCFQL